VGDFIFSIGKKNKGIYIFIPTEGGAMTGGGGGKKTCNRFRLPVFWNFT